MSPFLSVFILSCWSVSEYFFAILKPIFVAKAVFPIAGLPANITKSDFCNPPRALSRSLKPVDKPAKPPDDLYADSIVFNESFSDSSNCINPFSELPDASI